MPRADIINPAVAIYLTNAKMTEDKFDDPAAYTEALKIGAADVPRPGAYKDDIADAANDALLAEPNAEGDGNDATDEELYAAVDAHLGSGFADIIFGFKTPQPPLTPVATESRAQVLEREVPFLSKTRDTSISAADDLASIKADVNKALQAATLSDGESYNDVTDAELLANQGEARIVTLLNKQIEIAQVVANYAPLVDDDPIDEGERTAAKVAIETVTGGSGKTAKSAAMAAVSHMANEKELKRVVEAAFAPAIDGGGSPAAADPQMIMDAVNAAVHEDNNPEKPLRKKVLPVGVAQASFNPAVRAHIVTAINGVRGATTWTDVVAMMDSLSESKFRFKKAVKKLAKKQ